MGPCMDVGKVALSGGPRPLFSAKWVAGLAPVAEAAMVATIEAFTVNGQVYDPEEDEWVEDRTVHYTGKARIQPLRSSRDQAATHTQRVRFQVPVNQYVPEPDHQVKVMVSPLNPALLTAQFVVVENTDSSNPFETTFECTSNIEIKVSD